MIFQRIVLNCSIQSNITVGKSITFRILSNEEEDFILEIKMDADRTFFDLHRAITSALKYDQSLLTSFYLTNSDWEKTREITLLDMSEGLNNGLLKMEDTRLADHVSELRSRMLFVYDFFFERAFNIEVIQQSGNENTDQLPLILRLDGRIPDQSQMPAPGTGDLAENFDEDEEIRFESLDDFEL